MFLLPVFGGFMLLGFILAFGFLVGVLVGRL